MKCPNPKCRHDMNYVTDGDHNFWWVCPECNKTVGKKEEKETESDEEQSN